MEEAELKSFAQALNEIGKQTADLGLPLVFHPHMNQIGQNPEEVDVILKASDPRHVKLLLDTGHWAAAGGDPVKAIQAHAKRLGMLHIKDVKDKPRPSPTEKIRVRRAGPGQGGLPRRVRGAQGLRIQGLGGGGAGPGSGGAGSQGRRRGQQAFLEKTLGLKSARKSVES